MPAVSPEDADVASDEDAGETIPEIVEDGPVEPSPDDGDENGDQMELVRTGLIRIYIGGKRYRLRRPFFGDFKKLRLAVEDMNDEIEDLSNESLRVAREALAEAKTHDENEDPDAFMAWRVETRKKQKEINRRLTSTAEDLRIEWWNLMWGMLSIDGPAPDVPAWATSPDVPNTLLTHWRTAPSGRG